MVRKVALTLLFQICSQATNKTAWDAVRAYRDKCSPVFFAKMNKLDEVLPGQLEAWYEAYCPSLSPCDVLIWIMSSCDVHPHLQSFLFANGLRRMCIQTHLCK